MMDVEKGKGEQSGEKEKSNMMATKEEPMETEPIKEKTQTEEAGGKSAKTVIKDASRETAAGRGSNGLRLSEFAQISEFFQF